VKNHSHRNGKTVTGRQQLRDEIKRNTVMQYKFMKKEI